MVALSVVFGGRPMHLCCFLVMLCGFVMRIFRQLIPPVVG
jgi:hypothetical protein